MAQVVVRPVVLLTAYRVQVQLEPAIPEEAVAAVPTARPPLLQVRGLPTEEAVA